MITLQRHIYSRSSKGPSSQASILAIKWFSLLAPKIIPSAMLCTNYWWLGWIKLAPLLITIVFWFHCWVVVEPPEGCTDHANFVSTIHLLKCCPYQLYATKSRFTPVAITIPVQLVSLWHTLSMLSLNPYIFAHFPPTLQNLPSDGLFMSSILYLPDKSPPAS